MVIEKKETGKKPRSEKYEKSKLAINGTFDGAVKVFFIKPKENGTDDKK